MGCNGGMHSRALRYVKKHGLTTQDKYPYKAVKGECGTQGGAHEINDYKRLQRSEDGLREGLSLYPVAVAVDASNWKLYGDGIFDNCAE